MPISDFISRRHLLLAMLGLAGAGFGSFAGGRMSGRSCLLTPRQTEGPYYPPRTQLEAMLDADNDLTQTNGKPGRARGQLVYVMGQVQDAHCRPIEGAVVEIWQASENGRYHHPRDAGNPAPLDPTFSIGESARQNRMGVTCSKPSSPEPIRQGRDGSGRRTFTSKSAILDLGRSSPKCTLPAIPTRPKITSSTRYPRRSVTG